MWYEFNLQSRGIFLFPQVRGYSKIARFISIFKYKRKNLIKFVTRSQDFQLISLLRRALWAFLVNDSQYMNSQRIAIQYMEEIGGKRAFPLENLIAYEIAPILASRQFTCMCTAAQTCRCISRSSKILLVYVCVPHIIDPS